MKKVSLFIVFIICMSICTVFATSEDSVDSYAINYEVLAEKSEYIVGYSEDHSPFTYTTVDGSASGMAIGVMNKIADLAKINFKYVNIDNYEGHIDICVSILSGDILDYHDKESVTYVTFPLIAVGDHNFSTDAKSSIGMLDYVISNELTAKFTDIIEVNLYENYDDMSDALDAGDIDFIIASSLVATDIVQEAKNEANVVTPVHTNLEAKFTVSDELGDEFIDEINKVILSLSTEEIETIIMYEALTIQHDVTFTELATKYGATFAVVVLLIILFICSVITYSFYRSRRELSDMIDQDPLTGLLSETKFLREARKIIDSTDEELAIITVDIDNFKYINEIYGYNIGTDTLKALADHLVETFTDAKLISRVFADNYMMLTPAYDLSGQRMICGRSHCHHCTRNILTDLLGESYNLDTSVGIYNITDKSYDVSHMIDCANMAKSTIKSTYGRAQAVYSEEMDEQLKRHNEVVFSMESAVVNNEFKMVFQPKINLKSTDIIGAEALVRWFKSDGKQIFPDSFISLFEKNGFIVTLDYYVFDAVCEFIKTHRPLPKISVNLSGITLHEENVVEKIISILDKHGISPKSIEIEITESAIIDNFEAAIAKIQKLKQAGFSISMDDFGTGVSSLNRLKDMDIDILKIDKQFLNDSLTGDKGLTIIDSIIKMSKNLGLDVVAEGVETKEQADILRELGCDIAQGYYYARPLSQSDFIERLEQENK